MKTELEKYRKLRDQIDLLVATLENQHKQHLACKKGCDLCCMDYSIFPVEFYSILGALNQKNEQHVFPTQNVDGSCVFLKDHQCTIYDERPIICRTHGLPLLYMNEVNEWELSACELNFTSFDMNDFTSENTFPQDNFNSELLLINREFIRHFKNIRFNEFDLIPVRNLLNELIQNEKK